MYSKREGQRGPGRGTRELELGLLLGNSLRNFCPESLIAEETPFSALREDPRPKNLPSPVSTGPRRPPSLTLCCHYLWTPQCEEVIALLSNGTLGWDPASVGMEPERATWTHKRCEDYHRAHKWCWCREGPRQRKGGRARKSQRRRAGALCGRGLTGRVGPARLCSLR